jgi:DNA-binding response OmpR family regulator
LVKPFDLEELSVRIKTLIKRFGGDKNVFKK